MQIDNLAEKLLAIAIATCGHGVYLLFRFVRNGRVSPVNLVVLAFTAAVTVAAFFLYLRERRAVTREREGWRVGGDAPE